MFANDISEGLLGVFLTVIRRAPPSLNALRAFEVFSRRGSMSAAADELCVTHGAVSRQVRHLEAVLGLSLVEGPKARLRLTEAGRELAARLAPAFDALWEAVDEARAPGPTTLDVSCLGTFAMRWLIPRLQRFNDANPDIHVSVTESHAEVDFRRDRLDLAIRMSTTPYSDDAEKTPFLDHFHGPVVSPELWGDHGASLDRLGDLPRLHTRTFAQGWEQWEADSGLKAPPPPLDREFDHYFYILEAATAGLGVAIGPWNLVMQDIEAGRLIAPFGFARGSAHIYALRRLGSTNAASARFRDWLVEEGKVTAGPPAPGVRPPPAPAP
jgi:DNA-binding transcriptional LysR family regulator